MLKATPPRAPGHAPRGFGPAPLGPGPAPRSGGAQNGAPLSLGGGGILGSPWPPSSPREGAPEQGQGPSSSGEGTEAEEG